MIATGIFAHYGPMSLMDQQDDGEQGQALAPDSLYLGSRRKSHGEASDQSNPDAQRSSPVELIISPNQMKYNRSVGRHRIAGG